MSESLSVTETPVGRAGRALLLGIASLLIFGFGLACLLDPDPRGYGTHQRLGLPPCSVRMIFGIPCPGCGMTTSFAHFVRGQFRQAAQSNPAGVVLAMISVLLIPWSLWSAYRGRLFLISDPVLFTFSLVISVAGISMFFWISRLAVGGYGI